jgi:hypothetical protein
MKKIEFTEEQRASILQSIKEYEEGNYLTDEEAEREIQELLS